LEDLFAIGGIRLVTGGAESGAGRVADQPQLALGHVGQFDIVAVTNSAYAMPGAKHACARISLADFQHGAHDGLVNDGSRPAALRDHDGFAHGAIPRSFRAHSPVFLSGAMVLTRQKGRLASAAFSDDDDRIALGNAAIKVDDILIDEAHAAGRHGLANRPPFGRTVDAIAGVLVVLIDVEGARAERVCQAAGLTVLPFYQFRLALDHLGRRCPARPFPAVLDVGAAGPAEAVLAYSDAIADSLAAWLHQVKQPLVSVNDDGTGSLARRVDNNLPAELRLDLLVWHRRNRETAIGQRGIHQFRRSNPAIHADARNGASRLYGSGGDLVEPQRGHIHGGPRTSGEAEHGGCANPGKHGSAGDHFFGGGGPRLSGCHWH